MTIKANRILEIPATEPAVINLILAQVKIERQIKLIMYTEIDIFHTKIHFRKDKKIKTRY